MEMGLSLAGYSTKSTYHLTNDITYEVAIVGGGLAGLALSIQLRRAGHSVLLIEKETYPFHKVCGEYISMESWDFLQGLGVDLEELQVSRISKLEISSASGRVLQHDLGLGGFGVSRYRLDKKLAEIAKAAGVVLLENTKVQDIIYANEQFQIDCGGNKYFSKVACACFGKRSNIDVKWKRSFSFAAKNKLNNYVGVKYHVKANFPADTIALHNFKNGYCGIVKIEDEQYNVCYLTTAENLKQAKGSITQLEKDVLANNPLLANFFADAKMLFDEPLTISQISFDKKSQVENHVLMIGDAAGMITPLCGNGMSMALHGSKIACKHIHQFLLGNISRTSLEKEYTMEWNQIFARRLRMGRRLQSLFNNTYIFNSILNLGRFLPKMLDYFVTRTHGQKF